MNRLTRDPARTDLTDRECTKIIGSLLGGLLQMTDVTTVRKAVRWLADRDDFWLLVELQKQQMMNSINQGDV